jgi:hypothetical protein
MAYSMSQSDRGEVLDLIKMSDAELRSLIDEYEDINHVPPDQAGQREISTITRRLVATVTEPCGTTAMFLVVPRKLTELGIRLLQGKFVYPSAKVVIKLPTIDGESILAVGYVKDCRHVRGRIHELDVRFEAPIDVQDFLPRKQDDANAA